MSGVELIIMIVVRKGKDLFVRMTDGEDLLSGLSGLDVTSAVIVGGVGMVRDLRAGYWNGESYEEHRVDQPAELLTMQGNIAMHGSERIVHCHLSVARRDGTLAGGHLLGATVVNTAEIAIRLLPGITLERREEETGLLGLYPAG